MSVPTSVINIVSDLVIDNRYEHSLFFDSRVDQEEYFRKMVVKTFTGYTYLRRNWAIKVEADMSEARKWTYLFFYNNLDQKTYYYFITAVEYKNDTTVELQLEMDVLQTYLFDFDLRQCFIERTHVRSDEIGEHTVPEDLDPGELINHSVYDYKLDDLCVLILSATDSDMLNAFAKVYDGCFSGLAIYAVELTKYQQLGVWLDNLSSNGTIDAIVNMWVYPKALVKISGAWGDGTLLHNVVGGSKSITVSIPSGIYAGSEIDGYAPENNKVYTYPYCMLYVTNNCGGSAVYRFERFDDQIGTPDREFEVFGALSPDSGVKIAPLDYKGQDLNYDEGLSLGAFPSCAWDSDVYKVWLAQNQHSNALATSQAKVNAGFGVAQAIGSAATLNLGGAVSGVQQTVNAGFQIQSLMAQKKDLDVQPSQARGTFSANLNLANQKQGFSFITKTVTAEYAMMIDEYFDRYGYKINRVDRPSLATRERYTYLKTIGCIVTGQIAYEDRMKIQSIFDNGVTFWRDKAIIGWYGNNPTL